MGRVPRHIRGRIAGFWMRGNASEKLPVSLGLIPKQYADGGIDLLSTSEVKTVCWKNQGDISKTSGDVYNFSDVTQSQSNVQNTCIFRK